MLKIKHDPKQLVDSAAIPILFTVLFTYLFGGAISGSPGDYLKILLPGMLTMSIAIVTMYGGARLAQDVTTGAFDRFRALSDLARRLRARRPAQRCRPLPVRLRHRGGPRTDHGLPARWRRTGCARRGGPGRRLRALPVLRVGRGRPARPRPGRRHQHRQRRADAALVRQQHLRPAPHHARLAPGLRQRQPASATSRPRPGT